MTSLSDLIISGVKGLVLQLFEFCDTRNVGTVQEEDAVYAMRLVSSALSPAHIREVFHTMDVRRLGHVTLDQFVAMVKALFFTFTPEKLKAALSEAVGKLRAGCRRRFLMFADEAAGAQVDQEALVLQLAGSASTLAMYEELFAFGLRGNEGKLSREDLRRVMATVYPQQPERELREMLKVARPDEAGGIDLKEFIVLMVGARVPRALTDMVADVRKLLNECSTEDDGYVRLREHMHTKPTEHTTFTYETFRREQAAIAQKERAIDEMRKEIMGEPMTHSDKDYTSVGSEGKTGSSHSPLHSSPSSPTSNHTDTLRTSRTLPASDPLRSLQLELELARARAEAAENRAMLAEARIGEMAVEMVHARRGSPAGQPQLHGKRSSLAAVDMQSRRSSMAVPDQMPSRRSSLAYPEVARTVSNLSSTPGAVRRGSRHHERRPSQYSQVSTNDSSQDLLRKLSGMKKNAAREGSVKSSRE